MDGRFNDDPFRRRAFKDSPFRKDTDPRNRNRDDFSRHSSSFDRDPQARHGERLSRGKRRIRHSDAEMCLAHEVASELSRYGSHPSEWEPITRQEALYNLRAGDHIRIYRETRKGWETLTELNGVRSDEEVLAFRRRGVNKARSPGLATGHHQPRAQPFKLAPSAARPLGYNIASDPLVLIQRPLDDEVIEPERSPLGRRRVEWYQFQPGESAESVTRRFLDYPAPHRVCDGDMRTVPDPQPGDSCQVFMGYLLAIEGQVADAAQVEITWKGPTQGQRVLPGEARGVAYWRTQIPVKPGRYQVTARLAEGPRTQVEFEVVESQGDLMERTLGLAKELVNRLAAENRAQANEWFAEEGIFRYQDKATGRALTPQEVAERYRQESPPVLELEGQGEAAGAQALRELPQTPALIAAITALGSHGKSALRHPEAFVDDLKRALTHSRSETEALGEIGMRQAHRRLGVESDPRYVNRYHGPDEIGADTRKGNRLTETEAKGSQNDQVRVARDNKKNRQGSKDKNRQRARTMKRKEQQGKVGQPSNRQGGPYTEGEMGLWTEVKLNKGDKQHLLVHTNTTTGQVRTFEQVDGGKIGKKLDEFEMENFKETKSMIKEHFTKNKGQVTK